MKPVLLLPLLILLLPAIEIATFIVVGSKIGVLATLGLILGAMLVGTALLRMQGFALVTRIRAEMAAGRAPGDEMIQGGLLAVAAILILVPGFVSSTFGFLLLVPAVRRALVGAIRRRMTVIVSTRGGRRGPGVVDLDPDDFSRQAGDPSPQRPTPAITILPPGDGR
ncbi:FxsA family protein [Methylobrevis pamukkalensis]|uniref:Phage T7 F exclusion suppressor FxsA n=1 Tax=Methylobrevis pamukkalensis TaxID=1439726 RepID=A0A1E3H2A9_9HYPH|nr:FxsA family protein [Methylobrevis pamukkalensis]ODN70275.1 phage T7 F exclusion suppressor FxsA [Methylobrevis pamukkalensis]